MTAARRAASTNALVALVLAAAWFFWPVGLGGGTVYVTTHGISMQPRFHTGDLVILRPAERYVVGDVVAYRAASLDTTVLHRIVAMDGDRFVIQGDNNAWLDQDRPTADLVMGKLWLRVPQGGTALAALRSPVALALIGLAVAALLGTTTMPRGRGRRRGRPAARVHSTSARAAARQVGLVAGTVALLAGAGGGILLALPSTQSDVATMAVLQQGQFSYTGAAVPGATYPTGRVSSGEPIYPKLTSDLRVSLQDTFSGAGLTGVEGTVRLHVSLAAPDGWSAELGAGAAVPLRDGTATASVPVYPDMAAELLARHYAEVGGSGGDATLTVTPQVTATGVVAGQPFTAKPLAPLTFTLGATMLRPSGSADKVLAPTTSTPVSVEQVVPRHFSLLDRTVPISVARWAAGVVFALALIALAVSAWIARSGARGPVEDILLRNSARILPVSRFTPGDAVVDVSDGAALHRIAERLDGFVLHHEGPAGHTFAVRDVETTYRFVLPPEVGGRAAVQVPPTAAARIPRLRPVPSHDRDRAPVTVRPRRLA